MGKKIKNTMIQTAMMMAVLTLFSKVLGFVREIVMAGFFGTSYVVDAYVMASTILSTLFGGIIVAISTAYLPIFSQVIERDGAEEGNRFTSRIVNLLIIITTAISVIGIFFSNQIIDVFAPNFMGQTADLASFFVKVIFIYIVFYAIAGILEANLQYKGIFLPQILSGYCISLCIIVGTIVSAYTSFYYLPFGMLIGYAARCIALWWIAKNKGYKYTRSLQVKDSVKEIFKLAIPVFIGSYITYINLFVDKTLASGLVEGSIAALNYAALLNNMIISVTITILSTLIYPKLTQANALKDQTRFNDLTKSGFNVIVIIAVPFSLGAMLYSSQIIQIVYERGAFDAGATAMTGSAFACYAAGMFFFAINDFIVRIYYSMKDMKNPMIFGAISVFVNIALSLTLVGSMAHKGLALATSIAAVCNTVLLVLGMKKRHPQVKLMESGKKYIKIVAAAVVAVGASYLAYMFIVNNLAEIFYMRLLQLGISVVIAIIIYLCTLKIFKIEELKLIGDVFTKVK